MIELKKDMYVRFDGKIRRILSIEDNYIEFDDEFADHWGEITTSMKIDRFINDYKPKASYNIMDLIEIGDYVNGEEVFGFITDINNNKWLRTNSESTYNYKNTEIKSIVTREQFEEMKYRIGE